MKYLITALMLTLTAHFAIAQTSAEWFRQKKTQKKYLLQQIAALQQYIGYLKKGYSVAKKGLHTISDIKKGEFDLHDVFYSSLLKVNSNIAGYAKVPGIVSLQVKIIRDYRKGYRDATDSKIFKAGEMNYIYRVYGRLIDDCSLIIDELLNVTANNRLKMEDDERLKRIDILYSEMLDKYTFVRSFSNSIIVLSVARNKELNDVESGRLLNGIKTK